MLPRQETTDLTDLTDNVKLGIMQTTLRMNDEIFRSAKADAARLGVTLTRYIEDALKERPNSTLRYSKKLKNAIS
jgi:hypothetical protein